MKTTNKSAFCAFSRGARVMSCNSNEKFRDISKKREQGGRVIGLGSEEMKNLKQNVPRETI